MIILLFDLIFFILCHFPTIKKARDQIDHGPAEFLPCLPAGRLLRQPGYPESSGPVAFPACSIWNSGPPTNYGGQASHDYSWFGFIGNVFFKKQKIYSNINAK
jgi:hypothetical protein